MKRCSVEGCKKPAARRGLCHAHRHRLERYGSPLRSAPPRDDRCQVFLTEAIHHQGHGCLLWPFAASGGYARIHTCGKAHKVAILVCLAVHGPKPTEAHEVAHSCGECMCVNPMHLRWATRQENEADKLIHGRRVRGERTWCAKLTTTQVQLIRSPPEVNYRKLAVDLGISKETIKSVRYRKTWAWLPQWLC